MLQARCAGDLPHGVVHLPPRQCVEQIAREQDALRLPRCKTLVGQVLDARLHRRAHLVAEAAA